MTKTFLTAVAASAFLLTAAPEMQQITISPEVSTQEDVAVFQSKVMLIEVPVVVRDKHGKAVGALRQEDFQLFDKGKPQTILKFSVEKSGGGKEISQSPDSGAESAPQDQSPVVAPDHFVGLLFDDVHINFADLAYAREAAQHLVASGLKPADRVAVFTTSGQTFLDFTDDRDLLDKTLSKLALHWLRHATEEACPTLGVFQADRMLNMHQGIEAAAGEVRSDACYGSQISEDSAVAIAMSRARAVLEQGRMETNANMVSLKAVVRKLAEMPGQRTLILASPGFMFMQDQLQDEQPAIDLAIRSGVVINALDVKGVPGSGIQDTHQAGVKSRVSRGEDQLTSGILDDLAFGTGGRALHQNDLTKGLQELGAAPEVFYLLGFSPQNLKADGTFHSLKVNLKTETGLSVEARRGYYAPTHLASAEENAKEEVTQALFSHDEMNAIPVEINTRFFKASETGARLSVTSQVDVRKLRFRKSDGRNVNSVRVVCGLFDRNGNFVQAVAKTIEMNLLDATLEDNKLNGGVSVRSDFTVAPGTYVIRLVIRDAEGETMTAQNSAVRIP